jgi:hypothetical protein
MTALRECFIFTWVSRIVLPPPINNCRAFHRIPFDRRFIILPVRKEILVSTRFSPSYNSQETET